MRIAELPEPRRSYARPTAHPDRRRAGDLTAGEPAGHAVHQDRARRRAAALAAARRWVGCAHQLARRAFVVARTGSSAPARIGRFFLLQEFLSGGSYVSSSALRCAQENYHEQAKRRERRREGRPER